MDIWSQEKRSQVMSKIRSKNTKPELLLRSLLHQAGYRFRVYRKDLPGKPDLALAKYRTVIFVHGCFWHYHDECNEGRVPDTNSKFWREKLSKTVARDKKHQKKLRDMGWKVVVVWECEIEKQTERTLKRVVSQLEKQQNLSP